MSENAPGAFSNPQDSKQDAETPADARQESDARQEIEQIDLEMARAVIRRTELTAQIETQSGHVRDEQLRFCQLAGKVVGDQLPENVNLRVSDVADVLTHVASVCQRSIDPQRVCFLGPEYSYSHLAAIKYFGEAANFAPVQSIAAVFDAVDSGKAASGIVPIENSTDGRIVDTLGMFVRKRMQICGEILLPIHHNLLSASPREEIVEIQSKPQALSQCRRWLAEHFPDVRLVEVSSTTSAAITASNTPGVAAVASLPAGQKYGLDVIDANIEDNHNNVTRFAVLGRRNVSSTGKDKTSLLFQVEHKPGALADVMATFRDANLNLTWIESFPSPDTRNEYLFFVELAGHCDQPEVDQVVQSLESHTTRLEVLGSYAVAQLDE